MRRHVALLLPLLILAGTAGSRAKINDPEVRLTWAPQQRVGTTEASLSSEMLDHPVALEIADDRGLDDLSVIGSRTDDDDRELALHAQDPVSDFVEHGASAALGDWGVDVRDGADRTLRLTLLRFHVLESNQAVGATYEAQVRFEAALEGPGGSVLWRGDASGDATRYGKKFSDANTSEVLSDAVLEAVGALLSDRDLHRAWAGERTASAGSPGGEAIDPADLLSEVRRLAGEGVGKAQLVAFVDGRTLTRALSADDLLAWRAADLPDAVVDAVLDLPVR